MVKVMTEAAFNEAMENVKNQVIAEVAENLKEQLTQKLGKYTTLNMNDGVVAVAIDDEGLAKNKNLRRCNKQKPHRTHTESRGRQSSCQFRSY